MFSKNVENFEEEREIIDPLEDLTEDERQRREADRILKENERKKKVEEFDRLKEREHRELAKEYGGKIIDYINSRQKKDSRKEGSEE